MNYKNLLSILYLVAMLSACSENNDSPGTTTTPPIRNENVNTEAEGENLFEEKCTACHGSDGTAGIANAANLQLSKLDSVLVIQTISNGKRAMPSFKNQLTEAEINKLAHYISTLRK